MSFLWTTITVSDLEASLKFYQDIVGLPLVRRFDAGPMGEIAFLGDGDTKIELIGSRSGKADFGPDISLGFAVDSADEKIAALDKQGIRLHSGPFSPNPHVKFFFIQDPDGLKIQFVEENK